MPKRILLSAYREKQEQAALRKKYDIDTEAIVIEKKNGLAQILRVILRAAGTTLRVMASAVLVVLAVVGLCVFIYPVLRSDFVRIVQDWYIQLSAYFA